MSPGRRRQIGVAVRVGLSLVLLILLFGLIDWRALLRALLGVDLCYCAIGTALYLCSIGMSALRWHLILKAAGAPISRWQAMGINLVGGFFSMFLPTAVGGDLARVYEVSRQRQGGAESASTVLLDRLIGLISVVVMALVALAVGHRQARDPAIVFSVMGVAAGLALAWAFLFDRRLTRRVRWIFKLPVIARWKGLGRRLYESLHTLHEQPRLLAYTLAISLVVQGVEVLSVIAIARGLRLQVDPVYFFVFVPLIWIVTMVPVSVSGIGLREGAFVFFFGRVGVAASDAVALSLLVYACRLVIGLMGGLVFLRWSIRAPAPQSQPTGR